MARDWAVLGRVGGKRTREPAAAPATAAPVNEELENWEMRHDHPGPCDETCALDPRPRS